ncbi:hypothetical protein GN956_G17368 [Arapaima gigas]
MYPSRFLPFLLPSVPHTGNKFQCPPPPFYQRLCEALNPHFLRPLHRTDTDSDGLRRPEKTIVILYMVVLKSANRFWCPESVLFPSQRQVGLQEPQAVRP